MGRKTKGMKAVELATSTRGQWIIGSALRKAFLQMDCVPENRKEMSDMADMKLIGEQLFSIGWQLEDVINKTVVDNILTMNKHAEVAIELQKQMKENDEKDETIHNQSDTD